MSMTKSILAIFLLHIARSFQSDLNRDDLNGIKKMASLTRPQKKDLLVTKRYVQTSRVRKKSARH